MTAPKIFAPEYYARLRALEAGSWWSAGMRDTALRLLRGVGLPARGVLLDVGCGSGQTLAWFTGRWPAWRAVGFDLAPEPIGAGHAAGHRVFRGSALAIPLADGSVDAVVTLDVLQHLPLGGGDERALAEMARVLRPGGLLFVRTNAQAIPRTPDDPRYNFHKYSAGELGAKLRRAGFEVHRLGRLNALLGFAEVPRELRARHRSASGYVGLLAEAPRGSAVRRGLGWRVRRGWLALEGALVAAGFSLPLGRALVAVALARREDRSP